jgi:lysophospholipid acyltransferase (LPLAT)-like uncharacterized protein
MHPPHFPFVSAVFFRTIPLAMPASDNPHDPFNTRRPAVHELEGWRRLALPALALPLQAYGRSWRIRLDAPSAEVLAAVPAPRLIIVWHNRSLPAPEVFRRCLDPSRIACLISPSRMAAWEAGFFRRFHLRVVRGSSTRRSIQAAREILRELRAGNDAGISPDGPSGPLYCFRPGAVAIARKAAVPILLLVPNARAALRLPTWDRHLVPLPFARIDLAARAILPDDPVWREHDDAVAAHARRVCLELTRDPFQIDRHE